MRQSRRSFIQNFATLASGLYFAPEQLFTQTHLASSSKLINASLFGDNFVWGAASAAFQSEGAWNTDGRSPSVWDTFTNKKGKIKNNDNAKIACDFYHRYSQDIDLLNEMNFGAFRFSLSWSRILPNGTGSINQKGVDYYKRVIDSCLEKNITPWITLYHWDLPQALEDKGGWTNRDILSWFEEYCTVAAKNFGDNVKNWIILNEPSAFTSFGYMLGSHAPGKRGLHNFMPAVHHAALCQSHGARVMKALVKEANVGSTFSCSLVEPIDSREKNKEAANNMDALLNRLFIEPAMGLGYPTETLPFLKKLEKYHKPGDENLLVADFDFVGVQYYFRLIARDSLIPYINANQVKAEKRNVPVNSMGMEVYPQGITEMLQRFSAYKNVKKIYVTEGGVCFNDIVTANGSIHDDLRTAYFKSTLEHVLNAKQQGIPVEGYFVWSLTDNFEWNFGYHPRFGLVYIDYPTQNRILKDSGRWFRELLKIQSTHSAFQKE